MIESQQAVMIDIFHKSYTELQDIHSTISR